MTAHGEIRDVETLTVPERDTMFRLFDAHYLGASRDQFEADLAEKEWALVLRSDRGAAIGGFSTLVRASADGIEALFSGDTIVDTSLRSSPELARLWARAVFPLAASLGERVYWFLISSGYKTYRFLPLFFRTYVPSAVAPPADPDLRRTLDLLAARRFGHGYDPATGIVRLVHPTPLRPGIGGLTAARLSDPHVRFFLERNPGHARGDELACLAEISRRNLTRAGERMLR